MSIGPLYGLTPNYNFNLVSYDFPAWQSYEHGNWITLDATLATLFGEFGFKGVWQNGVAYNVNDRIIDADNNTVYLCLVNHQSAQTGSFEQDREANPSYWRSLSFNPTNRGNWVSNTQYGVQDIVINGSQIAICILGHLSSSNFTNDVTAGYWSVIIDVSGFNIGLALVKNNNLSDVQSVTTARGNLGLGSIATHASTDYFSVSNNLSEGAATTIRANLGLGTAALTDAASYIIAANNLSELTNKGNARTNLGLGTLATQASVTISQISDAGGIGASILGSSTQLQAVSYLPAFTGDTGSGGGKGLVPAPSSGDAAAGKFLSANGGFAIPNYPVVPNPPPLSYVINLAITVTSNVALNIAYNGGVITNAAKSANQVFAAGGTSISLSNVGPGGIQNGLTVGVGWYSVYLIGNGSTIAGLLSDTNNTPVLPSGYTFYKRIGWVRSSATSSLLITRQVGRRVILNQSPISIISGAQGTHSGGVTGTYMYAPVDVTAYIPPTGSAVEGFMQSNRNGTSYVSNNNTATGARGTVPPNIGLEILSIGAIDTVPFRLMPTDSVHLFVYSDNTNFNLFVTGWEDEG